MTHFDVNWIGVVLAAVASMALGMAWYMGMGDRWVNATGKSRDELMSGGSATPFVWAALCQLVMAYFVAMLTPLLFDGISIYGAVMVGVHMWVGFIITSMVLNHRYQNQKWTLTFIDGGYLLGVMIVQGVVIGLFG
jgi:Mg/Co/Ni transporter MgtE